MQSSQAWESGTLIHSQCCLRLAFNFFRSWGCHLLNGTVFDTLIYKLPPILRSSDLKISQSPLLEKCPWPWSQEFFLLINYTYCPHLFIFCSEYLPTESHQHCPLTAFPACKKTSSCSRKEVRKPVKSLWRRENWH